MIERPSTDSGQATEVACLADPVPAHPLLDGLTEIGRGESSIVLASRDDKHVFKV